MDRRETRSRIGIVTSDLATSLSLQQHDRWWRRKWFWLQNVLASFAQFQREVPHSIQAKGLQVYFPCGPELIEVSDPLSGGVKLLCLPIFVRNCIDFVDMLYLSAVTKIRLWHTIGQKVH